MLTPLVEMSSFGCAKLESLSASIFLTCGICFLAILSIAASGILDARLSTIIFSDGVRSE